MSQKVVKDRGSSLYELVVSADEQQRNEQIDQSLMRLMEVVDISVEQSLADEFAALRDSDAVITDRIDAIMSGQEEFLAIALPDGFTLPEAAVQMDWIDGHTHAGGAFGKLIDHQTLWNVGENDHHKRLHMLTGPDHVGALQELIIQWHPTAGHRHEGVQTRKIRHIDLDLIDKDDHHPMFHMLEDHVGELDASVIRMAGEVLSEVLEQMQVDFRVHDDATATVAHNLTTQELVSLGMATQELWARHVWDTAAHPFMSEKINNNAASLAVIAVDISNLQALIPGIQSDVSGIEARLAIMESVMPTKLDAAMLFPLITAWGGAGAVLGGTVPLEAVITDAIQATDALFTNLVSDSAAITALTATDLVVTGTVSLPEGSIEQTDVATGPIDSSWYATPAHLNNDLSNIRNIMETVLGDPWNLDGANPPAFPATSAFAGRDMKSHQEETWYRDWFFSSMWYRGLILDVFKDDIAIQAGGSLAGAVIEDHQLKGPGVYTTRTYSYTAAMYDVEYVMLHVEASDPAAVSARVTVNGGVAWKTITSTDFDKAIDMVPDEGREVIIELTITGSESVYSYGLMLGSTE